MFFPPPGLSPGLTLCPMPSDLMVFLQDLLDGFFAPGLVFVLLPVVTIAVFAVLFAFFVSRVRNI